MCAGAMHCDGNQDKRYKQRGIHGSLKASPQIKVTKKQKGRKAVRIRRWRPAMWAVTWLDWARMRLCCCFFLRDRKSAEMSCLPSPLFLFRCQFAHLLSLSVFFCCFFFSANALQVSQHRTKTSSFPFHHTVKLCFIVNHLTSDSEKLTFMNVCWSFGGIGFVRGKLTCMLHWKPTAVGWFWVVP